MASVSPSLEPDDFHFTSLQTTEEKCRYGPGGYHPITIGDFLSSSNLHVGNMGVAFSQLAKQTPEDIMQELSPYNVTIVLTTSDDEAVGLWRRTSSPVFQCARVACPPEVAFSFNVEKVENPAIEPSADIWALGTAIFEIVVGSALFFMKPVPYAMVEMADVLPPGWEIWHASLSNPSEVSPNSANAWWATCRERVCLACSDEADVDLSIALLKKILILDPTLRPSAAEIVHDPWFKYHELIFLGSLMAEKSSDSLTVHNVPTLEKDSVDISKLQQEYTTRRDLLGEKMSKRIFFIKVVNYSSRGGMGVAMVLGMNRSPYTQLVYSLCEVALALMMFTEIHFSNCCKEDSEALDAVADPDKKFELLENRLLGREASFRKIKSSTYLFNILYGIYILCWLFFFMPYFWNDWKSFNQAAEFV
ncbi:hypothetical protein CPB84DRAFT_1847692 [Gymnopilus junonius]|uniref:Protein kinase domain-containing protein n=1 Tax=Gymnopilus junonius TaxID=109634 RepID=A0A9P5TLJ2_GYMJU|nr:hypothetical protein CPB84DRAFT_1847692 [Gymnopilus junonius]